MNQPSPPNTGSGAALRVVLVYAAFASLWILLSDKAVAWLSVEPDTITRVSMIKGWLFVAVTAALLFALIDRLTKSLQTAVATSSQNERALQHSKAQLQATLDALPDLLFEVGPDGRIYDYHSHRTDLLAAPPEAFLGKAFAEVLPPEVAQVCSLAIAEAGEKGFSYGRTYALQLPQGERWFDLSVASTRERTDQPRRFIMIARDITTVREHQTQLEHMAHFDLLTSLPNRLLLADRLHQAMGQALRRGKQVAVAYLDLDAFKQVNDQHGHGVGDALLVALARRMKGALREGDTLARMGGDEFVAVLIDLDNAASSLPMLTRLLAAAATEIDLGDHVLQVSASVGVTFFPQPHDMDADQLLRQADQAMYQAKLAGKNRYHVFDAEQDRSIRGHHESLEEIRQALEQGQFVLHYQPKVHMRSGRLVGAEALIRWQHPQRGLLAPQFFLPVVEEHPLAVSIGEWVLDAALCQVEQWRSRGLDISVSVNVGAQQLQQANFVERLRTILASHASLEPACLQLEILETSAFRDMEQVSRVIDACAQIGVTFALDDFGTGYSSLTYLKRLRVTELKIDQSFVRDMLDDPDDLAILEGVIGLASAFKREVIAEGVESVAHGTRLLQLGCHLAQGYGIARPMPGTDLPAWAGAWMPAPEWLEEK